MISRRASRLTQLLALVFGIAGTLLLLSYRAEAVVDPTAFVDEQVMSVPAQTIAGDWLPDGRLLTLTRLGQISITDPALGTSNVLVTMSDVGTDGNRGAPDLELHPDFAVNGKFFVYHLTSSDPAALKIVEFELEENSPSNTASSIQTIWENPGPDHAADFHIGGSLDISHDRKLLLTIGDGQVPAQSTQLNNVFGKVIRLNLDGTPASDNPWFDDGDSGTLDDIWAYGLRNPFRASVDPLSGVHWVADVGGNVLVEAYEEVNQIERGENYGWGDCEGPTTKQGAEQGADCPTGVTGPWHYYSHLENGVCCFGRSITGGEVYRGTAMPIEMRGSYVYSDYIEDKMTWVEINPNGSAGTAHDIDMIAASRPVWVSTGPDGWIYYLRYHPSAAGGAIHELRRIRYTGTVDPPPPCNGLTVTVDIGSGGMPTPGDDVISGTSGPDVISGLGGDDTICGLGGDDVINGGNGADTILGGDGADVIGGQGGVDLVFGEDGDDEIAGGIGNDELHGGDGEDVLRGQGDDDQLFGEGDVDTIFGGSGNDTIETGPGGNLGTTHVVTGNGNNDTITGSPDADVLDGQNGLDIINGEGGADLLTGGLGFDHLNGGDDNDTLEGFGSRDILHGDGGDDIVNGGAGDDDLYGDAGANDSCTGGPGTDATPDTSCETIAGVP